MADPFCDLVQRHTPNLGLSFLRSVPESEAASKLRRETINSTVPLSLPVDLHRLAASSTERSRRCDSVALLRVVMVIAFHLKLSVSVRDSPTDFASVATERLIEARTINSGMTN